MGIEQFWPAQKMQEIKSSFDNQIAQQPDKKDELEHYYKTAQLENSYAGILGKAIEPAITPWVTIGKLVLPLLPLLPQEKYL